MDQDMLYILVFLLILAPEQALPFQLQLVLEQKEVEVAMVHIQDVHALLVVEVMVHIPVVQEQQLSVAATNEEQEQVEECKLVNKTVQKH
jgi:hypothetical protein